MQEASYGAHYLWRPDWYRDALGRQTNYVHSSATGQLTQQLDPADPNGVRRETDISYNVTNNISRKTLVRVCGQTTTCSGNAESHTEYTYFGNTFLPVTVTVKDEATGTTRVTNYGANYGGITVTVY